MVEKSKEDHRIHRERLESNQRTFEDSTVAGSYSKNFRVEDSVAEVHESLETTAKANRKRKRIFESVDVDLVGGKSEEKLR